MKGGINAVAKTADGGIYNVSGIPHRFEVGGFGGAQAEVKPQSF